MGGIHSGHYVTYRLVRSSFFKLIDSCLFHQERSTREQEWEQMVSHIRLNCKTSSLQWGWLHLTLIGSYPNIKPNLRNFLTKIRQSGSCKFQNWEHIGFRWVGPQRTCSSTRGNLKASKSRTSLKELHQPSSLAVGKWQNVITIGAYHFVCLVLEYRLWL